MNTSVLDATEDQLRNSQAKLTFVGPQTKPIPTVVFHAEGYAPSMDAFVRFHHSGRSYQNDELPNTIQFAVSPSEFMRFLRAVKPVLTASSSSGLELVSFTVVHQSVGGRTGEEFIIREPSVEQFYRAAMGALDPQNSNAKQGLRSQAAKMGLDL